MRIAVMQPYFIPYAGYFRLFSATDLVVLFDCVQFLRRGWMHRNRLPNVANELQWLTLPLKKQPQDVLIKDLEFTPECQAEWSDRLRKFDHLFQKSGTNPLLASIQTITLSPADFLVKTLSVTCEHLNLPFQIIRSSSLPLPSELKGQDRIIEICKHFKATEYINLAGGKALYDPTLFRKNGLSLKFLSDYEGSYASILHRTLCEEASTLSQDIIKQSKVESL